MNQRMCSVACHPELAEGYAPKGTSCMVPSRFSKGNREAVLSKKIPALVEQGLARYRSGCLPIQLDAVGHFDSAVLHFAEIIRKRGFDGHVHDLSRSLTSAKHHNRDNEKEQPLHF